MTEDAGAEARFVAQVMRQLEQALREVMAQAPDHGQQIVIHVQPKTGGVRIQLPPAIKEIRRQ
jgi:flagellar biosynthesis/type III secretory pathway protein FliH